jgi:hypothetical protein
MHATEQDDFETFYLHFLTSHTRAITRWMHVAAVGAGITGAAVSIATRRPLPVILGAAASLALAVGSHPLFEGNVPQNAGQPGYGGRALLRMCFRQVTGAIDADLAAAGVARE